MQSINKASHSGREKRLKKKYEQRQRKRKAKLKQSQEKYNFEQMFTYEYWVDALDSCKVDTIWKSSVQSYCFAPLYNIGLAMGKLKNSETPYEINLKRMIIYERGKKRFIEPVLMKKRHCEHTFCDKIFVPLMRSHLIHDNGASLSGKGTDFTRRRVLRLLQREVRKHGDSFYVWKFDFKSFFESIRYDSVERMLRKYFSDERIIKFIMDSIQEYSFGNIKLEKDPVAKAEKQQLLDSGLGHGLCLGSQVSQNVAIMIPNELDHFIKDKCGFKEYVRYMDDGIVFSNDKSKLLKLYNECKMICEKLGLKFNEKKTQIVKITRGFTFLKTKYCVKGHQIIRRPVSNSIKRCRRKLKKFKNKVENGEMTMKNVLDSFQAVYNHLKKIGRSYRSRKSLLNLYISLFGKYGLDTIFKKRGNRKKKKIKEENHVLLQSN